MGGEPSESPRPSTDPTTPPPPGPPPKRDGLRQVLSPLERARQADRDPQPPPDEDMSRAANPGSENRYILTSTRRHRPDDDRTKHGSLKALDVQTNAHTTRPDNDRTTARHRQDWRVHKHPLPRPGPRDRKQPQGRALDTRAVARAKQTRALREGGEPTAETAAPTKTETPLRVQ